MLLRICSKVCSGWWQFAIGTFSDKNYNVYEVTKPFDVQSSTVAPFYGQPGGGIQYRSNLNILDLLKGGYIKPVRP